MQKRSVYILVLQNGSAARFQVDVGPLGECSAVCGGGVAQRSLQCMDTAFSLPVDMSYCHLDLSSLSSLTEPCNPQGYARMITRYGAADAP